MYNTLGGYNSLTSGGSPPVGTVTVISVDTTATTATVSFSYDNTDQTGFDYSLDGGLAVDIFTGNPFVISSLSPNTLFSVRVRAYNGEGDGLYSVAFPFTTSETVTNECFNGFIGKIIDNTILDPVGFSGLIGDINTFEGGICNVLCNN